MLKEDFLFLENCVCIKFEDLNLDIYHSDKQFNRYHLWDTNNKLAVYSMSNDDLAQELTNSKVANIKFHEMSSVNMADSQVTVDRADGSQLSYNLKSGSFSIIKPETKDVKVMPEFFLIDSQYKLDIG